jgi:holo-[acyl-carrier protein] synthase
MIVGTGIDIAEVERIASSIDRFGRRFLERVFTPGEIRYCESKANKAERYAGRFAAKEAAMKAIGTGWSRGVTWQDVEVQRAPGGRPTWSFTARRRSSSRISERRALTSPSLTPKIPPWRR